MKAFPRRAYLYVGHGESRPQQRKGPLPIPATSRASARRAPVQVSATRPDAEETLRIVLDRLDGMKAEDVVTIDLHGKSSLADYMVVASGTSNRHVGAISDKVMEGLKQGGLADIRLEGLPHCDWVLIDAGDVIVHIFRPEVRAFYNLEKMWMTGRTHAREAS